MTRASLLQVIAQEASRFKVRPQDVFSATKTTTGFTLAGLSDGNHLYMAIRKST